jgi:glycosyltransferase involved in cell wall biosynthesis
MHALFLAGWWPTKEHPLNGVFIKEHAESISNFSKVTVVYLQSVNKSRSWFDFPSTIKQETIVINENLQVLIIDVDLKIRKFGLLEKQLIRLISQIIKRYEITQPISLIHVNVLNTLLNTIVVNRSERFNLPIVITEHSSFYHTEIFHLPEAQVETKKLELIKLLNMPKVKFLLPVSVQLGNVLVEDYLVPSNKIKNIPNVANDVFLSNYIVNNSKTNSVIIFAAAIWNPPKNPILFFELLVLLKRKNFELYNLLKINWAGEGLQIREVKQFVNEKLKDLNITFFGFLTKTEIAYQMSCADFLVHPTDAENLPCIIIEGLCSGLPILSSKVNGNLELIDDSNGLLYEAKNLIDFYEKFMEMISNINKFDKAKIAVNSRGKYNSLTIGKQIVDVYSKTI